MFCKIFLRDIQGIDDRKADDSEDVKNAYQEAMKALKLDKNERIEQLYSCVDSDEEMNDMSGSNDGSSDEKDGINEKSNGEGRNGNDEAMSGDDDDAKIGVKVLNLLFVPLFFLWKIIC